MKLKTVKKKKKIKSMRPKIGSLKEMNIDKPSDELIK